MANIADIAILVLLVVASSLAATPHTTEAAKHVVQWIIPASQNSSSFYSNLFANTKFNLNDILVFNYTTGFHNVVTLSKDDFKDCNVKKKMETFETGPTMIELNRTGEYYFACAFPFHCSLGQKLSVNVMASSSSPAMAPSSTASHLSAAATFPALLMVIAINILF
ncbi:hypothetical protein PIB30_034882 [Stylosanthes scabra]|uniref:Phytocyanin domain-containing protein n=1 Tax=Stylosanthes scabra TaxID=79078 RepID=A0ABU6RD37_9FABA|nr:hypothetical protein [Stylosanthes scabra]